MRGGFRVSLLVKPPAPPLTPVGTVNVTLFIFSPWPSADWTYVTIECNIGLPLLGLSNSAVEISPGFETSSVTDVTA